VSVFINAIPGQQNQAMTSTPATAAPSVGADEVPGNRMYWASQGVMSQVGIDESKLICELVPFPSLLPLLPVEVFTFIFCITIFV
jgi:hypothetical protein